MKKIRNNSFSILTIVLLVSLIIISNTDNLLATNLSRISNSSLKGYLFLNVWSILLGYCLYKTLRRMHVGPISYLALVSGLIGIVTPYNYLEANAFSSNMHLFMAYASFGLVTFYEIIILFKFQFYNYKLGKILGNVYIIIFGICLYLFLDRAYICTLCEMLYLSYILISLLVIDRTIKE